MKKILFALFLVVGSFAYGQLNNSWIDYSKTYYKFRVGKSGLYRINQAALTAAGLGGASAEDFQLWRNGEQVRLFTSVSSGPLGSSDYIEFWGDRNDGKPDKSLYRDPASQLSDAYSLCTDTAAFFLTTDASGNNLRYSISPNNVD